MTKPTQAQIDAATDLVGKWFIWLWATQAKWMRSMPDQETKDELIRRIAALTATAATSSFDWPAAAEVDNRSASEFADVLTVMERRDRNATIERCAEKISLRLNNHLVEMKPGYDDSITGFNEAWDIVRKVFEEIRALATEKK